MTLYAVDATGGSTAVRPVDAIELGAHGRVGEVGLDVRSPHLELLRRAAAGEQLGVRAVPGPAATAPSTSKPDN